MKTKRVELGDAFYVFTGFGLAKGHVVKCINQRIVNGDGSSFDGTQYKLNIDDWYNDGSNCNHKHGFFYCEDQLFKTPSDALSTEALKWNIYKLKIKE
jgi:hypothetical protein